MLFTEEQLKLYSKPLSESEKEKCENAIRIIQESLESLGYEIKKGRHRNNEDTLSYQIKMTNPSKDYELSIFVKGSYATNTNVRQNSDVDIAVVKESEFLINIGKVKLEKIINLFLVISLRIILKMKWKKL